MGAWLRRIRGRGPHGGCCVKHTPGPWAVDSDGAGWYIEATPERGHSLAFIASPEFQEEPDTSASEACANARLIAAAPDLLETLIWMVENDETFEGDTPLPDHHGATWNEINAYWIAGLNKARAAIAKATGEGE